MNYICHPKGKQFLFFDLRILEDRWVLIFSSEKKRLPSGRNIIPVTGIKGEWLCLTVRPLFERNLRVA